MRITIRREFARLIPFLCLLFVSAVNTAFAQFDSATVLGTIRDSGGAAMPGVTVSLKNIDTGLSVTAQTDGDGNFQFTNVRIGNYRVSAEKQGFSTAVAERVNVTVNARQRVDLAMQPGAVTESVVITDAAQLLETDSSVRGQVVQREQIVNLPLNGRSYANLALLTPGVRESSQNGITTAGREASFNVNGLRNTVNNFLLDGVDNNAYGTSNQSFSSQVVQVSPDAIAEFKVQTNTYSAEFGRSGGAVINASYRSGTNQFHGNLWEYNRNTALNAVGFFKPVGGVKPPLIRNQFGFTFGGPVIKDHTFFFLDYEGFRQISKALVFSQLPTLAQRNGILAVDVRDPLTGATYKAGTSIPMTNFARKVLAELPEPNAPGANNYQNLVPNRAYNDKFNIRLDHKFSDSLNAFSRISHRKVNNFEGPNIPGPSGSNQNGLVNVLNQQLVGGATYIFHNSSALEFRLGISRIEAGKRPPLTGGPSMLQLYGITGLPDDPTITGGLTTQTITGFSQLGRQATNPQFQNPFDVNPRVNYTFSLGRHSLKTGYEYLAVNTDVQDTNPLMGLDTYSGRFSGPPGTTNNLYNLADFMFGARSQYELADLLVVNLRQRLHYTYLQDDFKVSPKLTLNLGVRYEFATPFYEDKNRLSNYDPATNSIIQAKDGSLYDRSLVDPDYNNFAPRLGFAYNLLDKTVIRGGYGIGYVYFNRLGSANLLATNFPQITRANIPQSPTLPRCVGTETGLALEKCFRPTQDGYPSGLPNNVTLYVPRDTRTGYIQNWQLSVQRELTSNMLIDVAYVGNHAIKLVLLADLNQARPNNPGETLLVNARRPISGFRSISAVLPAAFSNYNALQVKFERRFSKGLYVLNSFTWSKAIDNVSQVLEEPNGNTGNPQSVYNIAADRGLSAYDEPINNTTSVVWNLPFGRGRAFAGNLPGALEAAIGGWTITAINTMRSGQTINLRYSPSAQASVTANLPSFLGGVALRPNISGSVLAPEGSRTIDNYFNISNVSIPSVNQPFGSAGRNIARSDAFYQFDFGLQKNFALPITEATRLEFRAEFFNLFNKTNFGAANSDRSSSGFGQIRSAAQARQIQFALKLSF
jgi:Carboxypeptidase regulatory-like domain/TonB dependent receptor-like, beta-barrel/TonB-dependent Receptor Plug Domain